MAEYLKDPGATLSYSIDWTASYLLADTLSASTWRVSPDETGGLEVDSTSQLGNVTSCVVSGGIAGHVYRLTNQITLGSGQVDERDISIRIGER